MNAALAPRYERIVSLVFVVLIGLAVVFLVDDNPNTLRIRLQGDLPLVSVSWLLIASLVLIACAGADMLARSHLQMQSRRLPVVNLGFARFEIAPGFWILPSFAVVSSFAFFRLFNDALQGMAFVLALLAGGGSLLAVLVSQHYALDRQPEVQGRAQIMLQVLTYLFAFGCFSAVYYAHFRTLYSATLIALTAALLAYQVLQWTPRAASFQLALLVGLCLAEATWALNYWSTSFLLGGTLLLIIFYLLVSLVQHYIAGRFSRRLLIEYGLLGGGLFAAVLLATFVG